MGSTGKRIKEVTKDSAKHFLLIGIGWMRSHPETFMIGKKLLSRLPWINARIKRMITGHAAGASSTKIDRQNYPASVLKVYHDLKQAIEDQRS
jgi:hypothetical protein